ncbi:MAG: ABC transporter permease [Propioniciclava sp.]|uniref:ABC transporter permease n=1 Tax=Propioniciclava sp. TaxID=2038686 RepID=UPI0039E626BD
MLRSVLARLGVFAASLIAASFVIFVITQALPGDVAASILGFGATPEQLAAKRAELGTDRPFLVQYADWAGGVLRGDFGRSWFSGTPVAAMIGPRLEVTASLVTGGLGLALLIALPLGAVAALKRRQWQGVVTSAAAQVGMAIPAFWAGILLVYVFAVTLRWFPANGYAPLRDGGGAWASHLVLPVIALGAVQGAVLTRYVRSAFVEVLGEDYYRTARSIGWTRWRALARHGVRNAALSLVTVLGLQLATVIVGAIVVERVFQLPGLGSLLLDVVTRHDLVAVRGVVLLLVFVVLVINALVDISYALIDPRLRTGDRS